jgi:glycosyltransferase involved in cell wall biosynthesis
MIFFSVIVPVYNRADLMVETIDSILQQTYRNFEIIIVDDGSTDNTQQVIQEAYGTNERVKYFHKENEERGVARNFGMKQAKGDYAVIFDSDDWMHPDHLAIIEKRIAGHPGAKINFIATKYQLKDESGKIISGASSHLKEGWYGLDEMLKGSQFGCMYTINLQNPGLHFFPPERKYATLEDWMFLLKNLERDKIYLIDRVTITVRHHDKRSMSMNQRVIDARKEAIKWCVDNLKLNTQQKKILFSYSACFCGIHYYLDRQSSQAIKEALNAIKFAGPKKEFVVLLLKSLVGRPLISRLKKSS